MTAVRTHKAAATRNTCKVCSPLGASVVYLGLEGCIPILHGGQGCSTYIRRFLIGHFRETVDIASTSFGETSAIFGGRDNFFVGLDNLIAQYKPQVVGIATTCLAETIGDDMPGLVREYLAQPPPPEAPYPYLVTASTPSYQGSHTDGYWAALHSVLRTFCVPNPIEIDSETVATATDAASGRRVALLPAFVSPEDLRHLRELALKCNCSPVLVPDYSQRLDDGIWESFTMLPPGGTPLREVASCSRAELCVELGGPHEDHRSPAAWLEETAGVPATRLPLPIGIQSTDRFLEALCASSELPALLQSDRARLLDTMVDAHKYAFGKRVLVYGDAPLAAGLAAFLQECGMEICLVATGDSVGSLYHALKSACPGVDLPYAEDVDFEDIKAFALEERPDLLVGSSKGYTLARDLNIPLVRCGFPVHDRFGGQHLLHVGYRGALEIFERCVNALLERMQNESPTGYKNF